MFKYAQIDETGRCISISYLAGEEESENLIPLTDEENVNPGDTYEDGVWTPAPPPEPVEPGPDRIAQLEAENAELKSRVSFTEDAILTLMDDLNMML
jgi:hypothetical protein